MHIALIAKPGHAATGVGRYTLELERLLRISGHQVSVVHPVVSLPRWTTRALRRWTGWDVETFFKHYPVWAHYPQADVYHITSQNLATLLLLHRPPGPTIVTVHDIIRYMLRDDPNLNTYRTRSDRFFDQAATRALRHANMLVADSHYTRQCLIDQLGIAPDRIEVVYLGVNHERFRMAPVPATLRERYGLPEDRRYLIYVGSEDPRKNLVTLVRALAEIRRALPDVELIKVGRAQFELERQRLVELAEQVGVRQAIHFLDDVPEMDLPLLYNLADVCVMPSLYEGFGFPVLEAMACGTPVVCAATSSLPELAGDAGLLFEIGPQAVEALAAAVQRILTDREFCQILRTKALAQAAKFTWASTARHMTALFQYEVIPCAGSRIAPRHR